MTRIVRYENGLCLIENEPEPIDLTAFSWYAGKGTSDRAAEKILISRSKIPGSFLVIDCTIMDLDYMLLVNNGKQIFRHEVRVFPDNSCIIGPESSFDDLPAAIEYYKKHKINGVYLYEEPPLPPPPPTPEATQADDDFSTDIGPPPRFLSHEEEAQFGPPRVKSKKSVSFKASIENKKVIKKRQSVCPPLAATGHTSYLDLGSITSINNGTAISPGLSSFETFKPHAQSKQSKRRLDTPIKVPQKNKVTGTKTTLSGQKSQPGSRIPKPTIQFTTKTTQVKPKIKKSAASQLNLSVLTTIDDAKPEKEPEANSLFRASSMKIKKKVAPPVPPRRSSLSAASFSTASLEEYANELGGTELANKTQEFPETSDDNLKEDSSSKVQTSPKTQATGKGKRRPSLQRGTVIPRSAKPHVIKKMPLSNPIQKSQITKRMSLESIEKDGHAVVRSSTDDSELEEVYRKITKFNWNSNEFSDHVTTSSSKNQ